MEITQENIGKSLYEISEILRNMPKKYTESLSEDFINLMKTNKIKNDFVYDKNKTLNNQDMLKDTKILLSILYRQYWCLPKEKEKLEKEDEEILKQKYNNLFEGRNIKPNEECKEILNIESEKKWYSKLVMWLKELINKCRRYGTK
ncbi:MAG: hypothetical protein HFJ17_06170 [Clostridia bacterium]|nr:hypothetical protein [Clostridia bacterium]